MTVARWSDLPSRLYSASVLGLAGFLAMFFGGLFLLVTVAGLVFVMHYELAKMQSPIFLDAPVYSSIAALITILFLTYADFWILSLSILAVSLICQYFLMSTQKLLGTLYSLIIILGGFYIIELRSDFGILFVSWVVFLVIVTDTFGYFGGRLIGGPKFFISISPNKTWAGVLSGWAGAFLCTYFFMELNAFTDFTLNAQTLFLFAIILSFGSQVGDLFESFMKRKCKVKDSSNIIPGHGGFLDRFDGIIVAILICGISEPLFS